MIEPGLIAPLPKLVTKSCIREGPPEIVDQKREITHRRCVKNYLQGWFFIDFFTSLPIDFFEQIAF